MKNIIKISDTVHTLLIKFPHLRDSDRRLVATIWKQYLSHPRFMNGLEVLKLYAEGDLPDSESITRCRRKIQEECVALRGRTWYKRHKRQVPVKLEIKELGVQLND